MEITVLEVGPLYTNCYLVYNKKNKKAIIIDPGDEGEKIIKKVEALKLEVVCIVNTHGHYDHITADGYLSKQLKKPIYINKKDLDLLKHPRLWNFSLANEMKEFDIKFINEGDNFNLDSSLIEVIETPGHTPGSISLVTDNCLFSGDLIFEGSVGRTDFPGSSFEKLQESLKKVIKLEENTIIYPGHGPSTTLSRELLNNPYLQQLER